MSKGKKLEDLYQALNEKRKAEGRPLIKSMTKVYNLAKPRRESSKQAKKTYKEILLLLEKNPQNN